MAAIFIGVRKSKPKKEEDRWGVRREGDGVAQGMM